MRLIARPGGALAGRFLVHGDRALSHRALILGALTPGETVIAGLLESQDVLATAAALRCLGLRVERFGPARWRVIGGAPAIPIDWAPPERAFGIDLVRDGANIRLADPTTSATLLHLPGDPTAASFALAAAALVPGSEVTVTDVLLAPERSGFIMALQRLGADLRLDDVRGRSGETIGSVRIRHTPLFGAEFTPDEVPSMAGEIPALAIVAAGARGETRIEGLAGQGTALATGLTASGVIAHLDGDALIITGRPDIPGGAAVATHGDPAIAIAFATLALAATAAIEVDHAETIADRFPGIREAFRAIGADLVERA